MFKTMANAFKIPELRRKIVFTLVMLVIARIGANIPVPGIDPKKIAQILSGNGGLLDFYDMVAGGAFSRFTLFALSITPYITASIVIQLLAVAIPSLEDLQKSGEEGRKKLNQYTRYLTIALALIQGTAFGTGLLRSALVDNSWITKITVVLCLTTGTVFLMWLGELITERGIGNGISIIIFINIVSRIPHGFIQTGDLLKSGALNILQVVIFALVALIAVVLVILVLQGIRKVPVQYAKRMVGRKTYGGQSTHIPLKVNQAGVIPVIFASSLMAVPITLSYFMNNPGFRDFVNKYLSTNGNPGLWIYVVLEFFLIVFFTYFYISITFKADEIAKNMQNSSGYIPGIRPGKATEEYLLTVLNRLSLAGAVFLALISIIPTILYAGKNMPFAFGGTSILIAVGVAIETMKQIEAQMVMRNYSGFLK